MDRPSVKRTDVSKVSRGSALPLYHQIASDLRHRILSGSWKAGERIPSEPELADLYETSRVTVRQALRILSDEGLISREPGRGSFVRDNSLAAKSRRLTSFTVEMTSRGMHPTAVVLNQQTLAASEEVADALDLPHGSTVLRLYRLRRGDAEPMGLQTSYVSHERFPAIAQVDFTSASLYNELHARYGIVIDEADEAYRATTVTDEATADLLAVPIGSAALYVMRRAFSRGEAVEYATSLMRADHYHIEMHLTQSPVHLG